MAAWRYEISLLVLKKYFTRSLRSLVKYFQHSKRNFVSPHGHVISSISFILPWTVLSSIALLFSSWSHVLRLKRPSGF